METQFNLEILLGGLYDYNDPESILNAKEDEPSIQAFESNLKCCIPKALNVIEASRTKNSVIQGKILSMMHYGIDVGRQHARDLGVSEKEVSYHVGQAKYRMRRILIRLMPELKEMFPSDKKDGRRKNEVHKLTRKERKEFYHRHDDDEWKKPRIIRIWNVIDGEKILTQDDPGPVPHGNLNPIPTKKLGP